MTRGMYLDVSAGADQKEPLLVARASGYRLHYAVEVEAARLLAGWKLAEALHPLAHIAGGGGECEHVVYPPMIIVDAFMLGALERIHAQVGQHRRT